VGADLILPFRLFLFDDALFTDSNSAFGCYLTDIYMVISLELKS